MRKKIVKELNNRGYIAKKTEVVKNGQIFKGITICKEEKRVAPNIYMKPEWEDLTVDQVCDEIERIYKGTGTPDFEKEVELFADPEYIREHVRLCIQKKSDEKIIKKDYMDTEIYPRVFVDENVSYKLPSEMHLEDVFEWGAENTKGLFEKKYMLDILAEQIGISVKELEISMGTREEYDDLIVISTESKLYGGSALCFTEVFKEICKEHNVASCYIIPSSIHEIIVALEPEPTEEHLNKMVEEVNEEAVEECERLADHVYMYSLAEDKITY